MASHITNDTTSVAEPRIVAKNLMRRLLTTPAIPRKEQGAGDDHADEVVLVALVVERARLGELLVGLLGEPFGLRLLRHLVLGLSSGVRMSSSEFCQSSTAALRLSSIKASFT